ncbi:MAG: putative ABC transporter permease [Blautia sp.]|nr:putative ABC transporter permease [Blautia sp.]
MIKQLTGYELLWLFLIYSFDGWLLETVIATVKQKKFANRGLVSGPFCILYGMTAVLMSIYFQELKGFWLFLFALVSATVIEWISGHLTEWIFKERWWDYTDVKWNLDGYICLPASLLWGGLGYIVIRWGNRLNLWILSLIPSIVGHIGLFILTGILLLDMFASFERRFNKAFPKSRKVDSDMENAAKTVFARDCSLYKFVLIFVIGAFLGDIAETIFCRFSLGKWMSRSSVIWGPFSIVWGLAIAVVTALLYKYKDRSDSFLFIIGTLLGGAYEYVCSVFTEIVFGKIFWNYKKIPFNLGGRINLLFCFFWGIAAVVWFKKLYPFVSRWIGKIPEKKGKIVTWCLILFMSINILASSMALFRYDQREKGVPAEEAWQVWMDKHYDDEKMKQIYPKAKTVT